MKIPAGNPVGRGEYPDEVHGRFHLRNLALCNEVRDLGINPEWATEMQQSLIEGKGGELSIKDQIHEPGKVVPFLGAGDGVKFLILPIFGTPNVEECEYSGAGIEIQRRVNSLGLQNLDGYQSTTSNRTGTIPNNVPTSINFARAHLLEPNVRFPGTKERLKEIVVESVGDEGSEGIRRFTGATFWEALVCGYHIDKIPKFWRNAITAGSFGDSVIVFPDKLLLKRRGKTHGLFYPGLKAMWSRREGKPIISPVLLPTHREYLCAAVRIVVTKS